MILGDCFKYTVLYIYCFFLPWRPLWLMATVQSTKCCWRVYFEGQRDAGGGWEGGGWGEGTERDREFVAVTAIHLKKRRSFFPVGHHTAYTEGSLQAQRNTHRLLLPSLALCVVNIYSRQKRIALVPAVCFRAHSGAWPSLPLIH